MSRPVRATAAALVVAALVVPAAAAQMAGHGAPATTPAATITMAFQAFVPPDVTVLAGDHVRWVNDSVRGHTVTADDGSFDAGRVGPGETYDRAFPTAGTFDFHCSLHAGMSGSVQVRTLLLFPPGSSAAPGRAYPLRGRAALPAGSTISVQADSGQGFREVQTASVDPDGHFTANVTPTSSATYRIVSGDAQSNPVALLVLDHKVSVTTRRIAGRDVVTATVAPPDPGGRVVLALRIPERFGWWPVLRARLNADSQARFTLRGRRRLPARVALTLPDGATTLAQSGVVHVGPVRRAG